MGLCQGIKMAALYDRCVLFVIAAVLLTVVTGHDGDDSDHKIQTYYMNDYCGTSFDMTVEGVNEILLELSPSGVYMLNIGCEMTIVTSRYHRLFFNFKTVTMDDCLSWIRLYGESTAPSDAISRDICVEKDDVYTTPDSKGILKFHGVWLGTFGGFKLQITSFYTESDDKCKSGYFKCSSKDRCIKSNLECNTRDNCGDESDEYDNCHDSEDIVGLIVGCVVGVIAFIILIAFIFFLCCVVCNKNKKVNKGRVHATNTGYPPATTAYPKGHPGTTTMAFTITHTTGPVPSAPPPPYSRVGPGFTNGHPPLGHNSDLIPPPAVYIPPYMERH